MLKTIKFYTNLPFSQTKKYQLQIGVQSRQKRLGNTRLECRMSSTVNKLQLCLFTPRICQVDGRYRRTNNIVTALYYIDWQMMHKVDVTYDVTIRYKTAIHKVMRFKARHG